MLLSSVDDFLICCWLVIVVTKEVPIWIRLFTRRRGWHMSVGAVQYLLKDMISSGCVAFREQNAKRIERSDSRQCNIELSVRKHARTEIYSYFVKRSALRFIDRHGKGGEDRKLFSCEEKGILVGRRAGDSWKIKDGWFVFIGDRAGRNELALEDELIAAVKENKARTVAQSELDVHVPQKHVHGPFFQVQLMRRHPRRMQLMKELLWQHVWVFIIVFRPVFRVSVCRLDWHLVQHDIVEFQRCSICRCKDDSFAEMGECVPVNGLPKRLLDEFFLRIFDVDAMVI